MQNREVAMWDVSFTWVICFEYRQSCSWICSVSRKLVSFLLETFDSGLSNHLSLQHIMTVLSYELTIPFNSCALIMPELLIATEEWWSEPSSRAYSHLLCMFFRMLIFTVACMDVLFISVRHCFSLFVSYRIRMFKHHSVQSLLIVTFITEIKHSERGNSETDIIPTVAYKLVRCHLS